ncbi:MAG: hypothetical protein NZ554_12870, partial [Bryobacteraceae bacterium]|nr:hypothetical protein [Bryobacteraceae bacterium]
APFGRVVRVAGQVADVALDERRGVAYLANYTANRIEVVGLADLGLRSPLNVAQQPASLAVSWDGRWLVATHFAPFAAPLRPSNALTVLELDTGRRQTFLLGAPPLGVAFGLDNRALVATAAEFLLLEPGSGATEVVARIEEVVTQTLPAPLASRPIEIVRASVAASADGTRILGILEAQGEQVALVFVYDVHWRRLRLQQWVTQPPLGPRAISVARDGSMLATGWGVFTAEGVLLAQFRNASGRLGRGSVALDSARGLVYAQYEQAGQKATDPPVLVVAEADNLTIRERLLLPAHLAGKAVLSADGRTMYAVADNGLAVLPVGDLGRQPRLAASREQILFRSGFCNRRGLTEEFELVDLSGGRTDFELEAPAGFVVSPARGTTPARVRVSVDPNRFLNQRGTSEGWIRIRSEGAVNLPEPVRVLVNMREPDQRGTVIEVPGRLVDILADAARNRFYILRQDKNQVLVYEASGYRLVRTLRTGNTPTQMAMTPDGRRLLIGADDSQIAHVYNLETLEPEPPIVFPPGHYPRSLAAAGGVILAACRVAGAKHVVDRVDLNLRRAVELPSLGVWENNIHQDTVLAPTPNWSAILVAQADGNLLLYSAAEDTFIVSRKDFQKLGGAYAALSEERFLVENHLLDGALAPMRDLPANGLSSGFVLVDGLGVRTWAPDAAAAGGIERVDLNEARILRPTRMSEAPRLADGALPPAFTRTLAALPAARLIVSLSISGFTALAWDYDAAVADPRIERVVNAADGTEPVAPGGLVTISGRQLSLLTEATREVPLPTALADSCLTVNGALAPMVLVSPERIHAQLPFGITGPATMILRTPGGVSNSFRFTIHAAAPAVFRTGVAGEERGLATLVRKRNNQLVTLSNPIHPEDAIEIYLTGLGAVSPEVPDGHPGPASPLAHAIIRPVVRLGGVEMPVDYAGLTPGQVGVYQINARVPYWVPLGMEVPLEIEAAGQKTVLSVRVVK